MEKETPKMRLYRLTRALSKAKAAVRACEDASEYLNSSDGTCGFFADESITGAKRVVIHIETQIKSLLGAINP